MRDSKKLIKLGDINPGHNKYDGSTVYGVGGGSTHHSSKRLQRSKVNLICVGNVNKGGKGQFGYTYYENGLSPTIAAGTHGYCIGHILVKENDSNSTRLYKQRNRTTSE